jgi:hypothetical protein
MACGLGVNWPEILPSCETATKSRSQPSGFQFNDLNSGTPFLQMVTTDMPTLWDVTFKFTRDNARIFALWLDQNNVQTNPDWFDFPIQIESGLTTQSVKFVGYPQNTNQDGGVFTYNAKMLAKLLVGTDTVSPIVGVTVDADWPSVLPSCETQTKSRNQPEGFKLNNVTQSAIRQEFFSSDLPTVWDVTFKFTRENARLFTFWLAENGLRNQSKWFKFPIQLEEGLATQDVRFLDYPQATGHDGDAFSYSAKIMSSDIVSKDKECPEGAIYIIMNKNCNTTFAKAAQCFDDAFNIGWPT